MIQCFLQMKFIDMLNFFANNHKINISTATWLPYSLLTHNYKQLSQLKTVSIDFTVITYPFQ